MDILEEDLYTNFNYRVMTIQERKMIELDWSKLLYNFIYTSYDFFEAKFPKGYDNIPGFNKVIECISEMNIDNSPLKELENLKSYTNNINE